MRTFDKILIVSALTLSYAMSGAMVYTLGLLQGPWVRDLKCTSFQASIVNSLVFAFCLIPSPIVQIMQRYLGLSVSNLVTFLLFISGLLITATATNIYTVMFSEGVLLGTMSVFAIYSSISAVYLYFSDDEVPLFTSIVSSGIGLGMLLVSLMFYLFEEYIGWRGILLTLTASSVVYIFNGIIFLPYFRFGKTVRANVHRLTGIEEGSPMLTGSIKSDSLDTNMNYYTLTMESVKVNSICGNLRASICNVKFAALLVSWMLGEASFNSIMEHQPYRMETLGYSLKGGATSLMVNGAIQIVSRMSVGMTNDMGIISPIRLSMISKLIIGISSIISNWISGVTAHSAYMLIIGACGGIFSTTDFILVKDCCPRNRDVGLAVLLLVDGIFSLFFIAASGYFYQLLKSYVLIFDTYGVLCITGFVFAVILEILIKLDKKNDRKEYQYLK